MKLALALAFALGAWAFAFLGPTAIRQWRWIAESREVLPSVEGRLASDRRFVGLKAGVSTGGSILVVGKVSSENDARDLRAMLDDIAFPHGVLFLVRFA